jgi:hypothetical protein
MWVGVTLAFALACSRTFSAETAEVGQFHKDVEPLLKTYCYECHGGGNAEGDVAFDELSTTNQLLDHQLWGKVLVNVRAGLMPAGKAPHPTAAEQKVLEDWVKYQAFGIDPQHPDPGRVTLRRLNRVEYKNTIHDLVGVDFNTDDEFPPDDTGYGFDDIGDVLTVSPLLLEKYIKAATTIVDQGVPKVSKVIPQVKLAGSKFRGAGPAPGGRRGGGGGGRGGTDTLLAMSYYKAATVSNTFTADNEGSYKLSLELSVKGSFEFDPGKCHVIFKVDDKELMSKDYHWEDNKIFPVFVYDEKWKPGPHQITFEVQPLTGTNQAPQKQLDMRIDSLTIQGPMEEKYWNRPKNYEMFFTKDPPKGASDRRKYAREVLDKFTFKAFRRPVDAKTVDRLVTLAESVYKQPGKTFEEGVGYAIVAVLSSPRFLFLSEQPETASSKDAYALVDEYSLASRLSYFLWSSMPDEELFNLAGKGELRKNLSAQVKRMLDDSRSEAMVDNFTGQWLQVRDVEGITIDARTVEARDKGTEKQLKQQIANLLAGVGQGPPKKPASTNSPALASNGGQTNSAGNANDLARAVLAPGTNAVGKTNLVAQAPKFDPKANFNNVNGRFAQPQYQLTPDVRHAMEHETQMAFSTVMHEDRSCSELIDSDYIFVNGPLAKFYGLTNLGITGNDMKRIDLPEDSPRGGVLTEGSFLVVTSNPDRTSPVKRGLFVLNNILGSPPPPPPPNVPSLEVAEKDFHDHEPTLKETLSAHRDKPECAMCHSRLDPVGLAFENFNALGVWRNQERSQTIDAAGRLVTGENFQGVRELKHIIVTKHRDEFYRTLATKLLTYATGRGLEYYDTETVDQIVQKMDEQNGKFSALLTGIIDSAPFQEERRQANPTISNTTENPPAGAGSARAKTQSAP